MALNLDRDVLGLPTELRALPAYGRQYDDAASVERDWNAGKDFKIVRGPYFSIHSVAKLLADGYTEVWIFYAVGVPPAVFKLGG